ncbi:uncharacterized protein LOC111050095 [Nilaparvata lugens]|uniref:uncharacterized protein LOC111050095 n=1 Tax=Nilaparvata lugens TaxID=108931 RepID=UPI00193CC6D7|nr:uncharacterized protein LOC111050095 [Nilaparvata lugens]
MRELNITFEDLKNKSDNIRILKDKQTRLQIKVRHRMGRVISDEERKLISERMKKYWAERGRISFASISGYCVPTQKPEGKVAPEVVLENFSKLCNKGPEVWCQNPLTAKQCGAVDHCIQTVWEKQSLDVDSSHYCQSCMNFVINTKDFLAKNATVDQAKVIFDTICLIAPSILSPECKYVVDKSLPELQKYIETVSPHTFCATLMLCNSQRNQVYLNFRGIETKSLLEAVTTPTTEISTTASSETSEPTDLTCANCHSFFTTSKYMYEDSKPDDNLNGMLRLCGQLSSFSDFCSALVQTNFNLINERIKAAKPQDFCHYIPDCNKRIHFQVPTTDLIQAQKDAPKVANDETCDFCVAVVQHLRDIVIANTTKAEFHKVLNGLCNQLGNYRQECSEMVDQYFEIIYMFLTEELDGKELCTEIRICPKISKDLPVIGRDEAKAVEVAKNKDKPELHKDDSTHGLHLLGANKCTWGPNYWCSNFRTSKDCKVPVKLCIPTWEQTKLAEDNGEICKVCKDMIQQARDQLNSNETQEELKEVFEGSCNLIPVKMARKECIKVVDEFVPELVEALSSQMNPQIVCATAGLCNNAKMDLLYEKLKREEMEEKEKTKLVDLPIERMFPVIPTTAAYNQEAVSRASEACELCELFLHFTQQQITLPANEQEIKKVVDQVCLKMASTVASQCSKFVAEYGDAFIALLAQRIDPSQVCPKIGACMQLIDNVKPTCPMCMLAVRSLEETVANNKTEESIKHGLDNLCSHLGAEMRKDCERFVNTFTEDIVNAVMADFNEKEVCAYLKMCSAEVMSTDVVTFDPHATNKPATETVATKKPATETVATKKPATETVATKKPETVEKTTPVNIETNEVHDDVTVGDNKQKCVLCEFVLQRIDNELKDKKTEDEIKHAIHTACSHMPHTVVNQCNQFINQYADLIFDLLADSLEPKQICTKIGLCKNDTVVEEVVEVKSEEMKRDASFDETSAKIVYSCLGAVGVIAVIVLVATGIKSRNSFIHNTPYIRVTK